MPVKYECMNCGKRYVEWGAEKLGFRCPDCTNEELVRVGAPQGQGGAKKPPTLKRGRRDTVLGIPEDVSEDPGDVPEGPDDVSDLPEKDA